MIKTYGSVVPDVPANLDDVISKARDYFNFKFGCFERERDASNSFRQSLDEDNDFFSLL